MIQFYSVTKTYDGSIPGLVDVSLEIESGEFVFVTGPSGAGKSTLLKLIFGTELPTQGSLIVSGRNFLRLRRKDVPYLRRRTGYVFQDFKLLWGKSVFDNVALSLKIKGLPWSEIRERVLEMLNYLKIEHRAGSMPLSLSGGEQQRVAIARALITEPLILLADEPTGNVDPELALKIMELFRDVNSRGTTVVVATHDTHLINLFKSRTIELYQGRLVDQ